MKRLKIYKQFESEKNTWNWDDVIKYYDVYSLLGILSFTYGKSLLKDVVEDLLKEEEDYNPDEYYDIIKYILEGNDLLDDFLKNVDTYERKHAENNPSHWRYREKELDNLIKRLKDGI